MGREEELETIEGLIHWIYDKSQVDDLGDLKGLEEWASLDERVRVVALLEYMFLIGSQEGLSNLIYLGSAKSVGARKFLALLVEALKIVGDEETASLMKKVLAAYKLDQTFNASSVVEKSPDFYVSSFRYDYLVPYAEEHRDFLRGYMES